MKIFRMICIALLLACDISTAYYALIYKASLSTGVFFICLGLSLYVIGDDSMDKKKRQKNK